MRKETFDNDFHLCSTRKVNDLQGWIKWAGSSDDKISKIISQQPTVERLVTNWWYECKTCEFQRFYSFWWPLSLMKLTTHLTPLLLTGNLKMRIITVFGRSLLDLCCTHDFHTLNSRMFDDKNGEMTCVALYVSIYTIWFYFIFSIFSVKFFLIIFLCTVDGYFLPNPLTDEFTLNENN